MPWMICPTRVGRLERRERVDVSFCERSAANRCSYHTIALVPQRNFCPHVTVARCRPLGFLDGASALSLDRLQQLRVGLVLFFIITVLLRQAGHGAKG